MTKTHEMGVSIAGSIVWRRALVKGGIATLFAFPLARLAKAADGASLSSFASPGEWQDRVTITDLVMRERWAREARDPEVAAACFHPDAWVEVSWFKGSGTEFVEQGKRAAPSDTVNFDSLSPPVIWVRNDRAIADASCTLHTVLRLGGVEVLVVSYTRLLWRLQKLNGAWLIQGMRAMYIRDSLQSTSPHRTVRLDQKRLNRYRPAYRHLSYVLAESGRPPRDDMAGVDQPETVAALHAAERHWFEKGG